jgi:hypothetical protein
MKLEFKGNKREVEEFFSYLISMEVMGLSKIVNTEHLIQSGRVYSRSLSIKVGSRIGAINSALKK